MRLLPLIGLLCLPAWAGDGFFGSGFEDAFSTVNVEVVHTLAIGSPCGVVIAKTAGGAYALLGSHDSDEVFSYALDLNTGGLSLAGSASSGGTGPSAIAVNGDWIIVANELNDTVSVLQLNGATGALAPAHGPISTSPGFRPAMVAVTDGGYVAVGNRNGILNVFTQNPDGTLAAFIASETLGIAIEDMAHGPGDTLLVADPALGTTVLYQINPNQTVSTLDTVVISDPVRVAHHGDRAYVASFDMGGLVLVHSFDVENGNTLNATGGTPYSSQSITDLAPASDGVRLYVAHSEPPTFDDELAVLAPTADGLKEIGNGPLGAGFSTRNVASTPGNVAGIEFAVITRFDVNQTAVVKVE